MPDENIETLDSTQSKASTTNDKVLDKRQKLKAEVNTDQEKFDTTYEQMTKILGKEAAGYYYEIIFPQTKAIKHELEAAANGTPEEMGATFNNFAAYLANLKKQLKNDLPKLNQEQSDFILQITLQASGFKNFQNEIAALDKEKQKNFLLYLVPIYGPYLDLKDGNYLLAVFGFSLDIVGIGASFFTGGTSTGVATAGKAAVRAGVSAGAKKIAQKGVTETGKTVARKGLGKGLLQGNKILRLAKAGDAAEGFRLIKEFTKSGSRIGKSFDKAADVIEANERLVQTGIDATHYLRDRNIDKKEKAAESASDLAHKSNQLAA